MIVVDTSALLAILLGEDDADVFRAALRSDQRILVDAVTLHETLVVLLGRRGSESWKSLEALLRDAAIETSPFDRTQARLAAEAYDRYGKGRGSRAQLNLCDCAAYALAMRLEAPLLFKGDDFPHTDVARCV